jgi:hypothetical protein
MRHEEERYKTGTGRIKLSLPADNIIMPIENMKVFEIRY